MTKTEQLIQDLTLQVNTLDNRLNNLDKEIDRIDIKGTWDRLTRLETRLEHLEKQHHEGRGKSWTIFVAVFSAIRGGMITISGQLIIRHLNR